MNVNLDNGVSIRCQTWAEVEQVKSWNLGHVDSVTGWLGEQLEGES